MMFASRDQSSSSTLRRLVESKLLGLGYALRPARPGSGTAFDIVNTRDDRVVWVNSTLGEIAALNEALLVALRHTCQHV